MMGVIGVLFDRRGQLFHACGGLLNGRSLLFGTRREIGVTGGNLARAAVDLLRPLTYGAYGVFKRVLHGLQIARQAANFAAPGHVVRHRQVAFGDILDTFRCTLQRINDRAAQHDKGHCRQHQRQRKRAHHKHQAQLRAAVRLRRQRIGTLGADLNRLQQHGVISVIQRTRRFVFVVDNRFEHAVFGEFHHRLHARNIGVVPRLEILIQRCTLSGTHGTIHIGGKALLGLLNARFRLADVLLHRIHLRDTACRTGVDQINTRGTQMV